MTQNIYDDPDFFAGYSRLGRSIDGLDGAAEWPSLRALLPDLRGLRVVDLGCGFGWFCRWARAQGAAELLGIDVSEKMLARARDTTADPAIIYSRADLERLDLPETRFDLVYSSLALHYVEDLAGLLGKVSRALVASRQMLSSRKEGVEVLARTATWPIDGYLCEGPRKTDWLATGVVKQHRTLGTYLNLLLRLSFGIAHVEEWGPTDEQIAAHPSWAEERQRPMFLLVAARR